MSAPVLSVCVMDRQCCYAGELFPLADLPNRLAERVGRWARESEQIPRCLTVTDDPGALIAGLDRRFRRRGEPGERFWQWALNLRPASIWLGRTSTAYDALTPHLSLFGWAARRGRCDESCQGRRCRHRHPSHASRYYPVLDAFGWRDAGELLDEYPGLLVEQMARFAGDIQDFCEAAGLRPGLTPAAIAGQLLRDQRFSREWGRRGRKVPQATNKRARRALPGNLYRIVLPHAAVEADKGARIRGEVLELDISGAHHWAAMHLRPPAARSLFAWGRFYEPARGKPSELVDLDEIPSEHGLLLCAIESYGRLDPLSHPATNHNGIKWRYVWTPEVPAIEAAEGVQILGAKAGWTSNEVDEGLCEYAWWATQELAAAAPARRRWLKQPLLAAYGLLAARPRPFIQMARWGAGDPAAATLASGHTLHGYKRATAAHEPRTANVIWRGMVEAWVRAETLTMARELRAGGWRIVSLYADAVYVLAQPGREPELRPGWRHAQTLTGMTLHGATHFTSDQVDKLPGIPRARRAA